MPEEPQGPQLPGVTVETMPPETQPVGIEKPPEQDAGHWQTTHLLERIVLLRRLYRLSGRDPDWDTAIAEHGGPGTRAERLLSTLRALAREYTVLDYDMDDLHDAIGGGIAEGLEARCNDE